MRPPEVSAVSAQIRCGLRKSLWSLSRLCVAECSLRGLAATSTNQITTGANLSEGGLIWVKVRSTSDSHGLFDTIRGPSNYLYSNATSANEEYVGTGVVSFDDDGFTLEGSGSITNRSGGQYMSWSFRSDRLYGHY